MNDDARDSSASRGSVIVEKTMDEAPKKDVLESLRGLLKHRTDDLGCYEFVLEAWIDLAADEIERLRGLIDNASRLMEGSPVGSGCYEARQMLTGGK